VGAGLHHSHAQTLATAGATATWLMILGVGLGMATYGWALALAADRRRALSGIGIGLAAGALLGHLSLGLGRSAFVACFAAPTTSRVVAGGFTLACHCTTGVEAKISSPRCRERYWAAS
jgi:hypothetical protein